MVSVKLLPKNTGETKSMYKIAPFINDMLQTEISRKRGEIIENSYSPLGNSDYRMGFGHFDRYLN